MTRIDNLITRIRLAQELSEQTTESERERIRAEIDRLVRQYDFEQLVSRYEKGEK